MEYFQLENNLSLGGALLLSQVKRTIEKYRMILPGDLILVGLSGGPDSVALLHVLTKLQKDLNFQLYAAHLDHMFRGEESKEEADFAERLCREWQVPVERCQLDVPKYLQEHHVSTQQGARNVRYGFYLDIAKKIGASKVALGHHADDQIETVLINLIRGAGLKGLSGIPPVRESFYIRPLLEVRKADIIKYCKEYNLPYRIDSSNLKTVYLRNRIRLELIPLLEQQYNSGIADSLLRLTEIMRDEDDYLDWTAVNVLKAVTQKRDESSISLNLEKLQLQPTAIKRRVIMLAYGLLVKEKYILSYEHIYKVLEEAQKKNGKIQLPNGVILVIRYGLLEMTKGIIMSQVPFYRYNLNVPGITLIPEVNKSIVAEVLENGQNVEPRKYSANEAVVDFDKVQEQLIVRKRLDGDVFFPLGKGGKMKLKKFFINLKMPREQRDYVPVVLSGKDIVWVAGCRPAESFKVSQTTKRCLKMSLIEDFCY